MFSMMANALRSHCNTDEEGWSLLTHHSIQVTLRSPTKGRFSQHHSEASAPQRSGKDSFAEWLKKKSLGPAV